MVLSKGSIDRSKTGGMVDGTKHQEFTNGTGWCSKVQAGPRMMESDGQSYTASIIASPCGPRVFAKRLCEEA